MCIYNIKAALFCLEMGFFYQAAPQKNPPSHTPDG